MGARFRQLPLGVSAGAAKREYFFKSRHYEGCGDRIPVISGKYFIRNSKICVGHENKSTCRTIFVDNGKYYQRIDGVTNTQLLFQRVEITPISAENCKTQGITP